MKLVPLSLIDIYGGNSYRLEGEYKVYRNIAHTVELGKYFGTRLAAPIKLHPHGFILRTAVKCYLNKKGIAGGNYLELEYLYKNITFELRDSILIEPDPAYEKQYTVHKEVSAVTFKYGSMLLQGKRFIIDWYVGAGARFFTNGYLVLSQEEQEHIIFGTIDGNLIHNSQRIVRNEWVPNINAGIKLGFKIK